MDSRFKEISVADLFDQFIEASTMKNVLSIHQKILEYADVKPCRFDIFYPRYKRAVMGDRILKNWKAKALFSKIDKKSSHRCYSNTKTATPLGNRNDSNGADLDQSEVSDANTSLSSRNQIGNNALQNHNCLIIGAGPAGLRTAIELQFLGAGKVVVVEKRGRFSRNNVLHLWPFVIDDLKSLGAKKFYGKFCAGSIDHISIRQLQLILLKVTLMIGCDFRSSCSYISLCQATIKQTTQITEGNKCDNYKACCGLVNQAQQQETTRINEPDLLVDSSTTQQSVNVEDDAIRAKDQPTIKIDEPINNESDKENRQSDKVVKSRPHPTRVENLRGARAHFESESEVQQQELESYEWDIIIGADGRRNTLSKFFPRKEFRGRLAIAITANFINRQTPAETAVPEISGLSFIYNQDMFNSLAYDTNIALENICYYKDDTHYFVMTAKKKSLLERGVLIKDYAATHDLLSDSNVDRDALLTYAKDAAFWTTGLEPLDFALNHYGQEDCAMFDFTSMYAASNACKAIRTATGGLALVGLVGDSLLEPFWPTGSGCARGFLSSFDAAWMCRQWAVNRCAIIDYHSSASSRSSTRKDRSLNSCDNKPTVGIPEKTTYNKMALSVMAERESIYRILTQTTSENLQQNYSHWTLNPHSRYPNLNRHLVLPYQVEHLITDNEFKVNNQDTPARQQSSKSDLRFRRVKSPREKTARRSPKKLKSATASPLMPQRNLKNRSRSLSKPLLDRLDRDRRDEFGMDPTFMEFEKSYRNLNETDKGSHLYYLNHRGSSQSIHGDLLTPSISGTHPSSNNLMSLEAKRARDIDECLRQRRQKSKMHIVRDQLIDQFRGQSVGRDSASSAGNVALFNELRRLREQRSKDRSESRPRDINGPLSLLNSMRRCASFAERVKSFEGKMSPSETSTPAAPKTAPIDNVRNLPQFVLLQELFVNGSNKDAHENDLKKTRIPITKLSKDDWNVKCWEKRLALYKQKSEAENFRGSSKSLNKSLSVDNHKPQKQIEVFKDRIKEMANKLDVVEHTKDKVTSNRKLYSSSFKAEKRANGGDLVAPERPQSGWVKHLKNELTKEAEANRFGTKTSVTKGMNPSTPSKPIKKLFEDDDDDDHNQHFDHLCVNKNIWRKGSAYTSHLARSKYDTSNWRIINKPKPQVPESQRNPQTSRSTSPSSTLSNYSTATGQSSTDSGSKGTRILSITECARCKDLVNLSDKITVANTVLHRKCLTCADCGITLRSNEIEHHLEAMKNDPNVDRNAKSIFVCAICEPSIRKSLNRDLLGKSVSNESDAITSSDLKKDDGESHLRGMKSRQNFLDTRIDYDELYKNIIDGGKKPFEGTTISALNNDDQTNGRLSSSACCRIETETGDDGIEKATLTLPVPQNESLQNETQERSIISGRDYNQKMIDEDDLQRILHLGRSVKVADSRVSGDVNDDGSETTGGSSCEDYAEGPHGKSRNDSKIPSEASSSLNSPPETDEYEDEDDDDDDEEDEGGRNDEHSTYGFITSEEFGATSDKEQDGTESLNGSDNDEDHDSDQPDHAPRAVGVCKANV